MERTRASLTVTVSESTSRSGDDNGADTGQAWPAGKGPGAVQALHDRGSSGECDRHDHEASEEVLDSVEARQRAAIEAVR